MAQETAEQSGELPGDPSSESAQSAGGGEPQQVVEEFDSSEVIEDGLVGWAQVWHLPVLLLGMTLLVLGVWLSLPDAEPDDFPGALDTIEQYMVARNYETALENISELDSHIARAAETDQARFEMLHGDVVYLQQLAQELDIQDTHELVLYTYGRSRELGQLFDAMHLQRWAATLVALGRDDDALAMIEKLRDQPAAHRYMVVRRIIESKRASPDTPSDVLRGLLIRFQEELRDETVATKRRPQEIWAVGLTAQLLNEADYPDEAIDYLGRKILRFKADGGDTGIAPLLVQLARAYHRIGRNEESRHWFEQAREELDRTDDLNSEVLVGLAQVAMAQSGDAQQALELFSAAQTQYPSTPAYVDALVGRADSEAHLGAHRQSIEHFSMAVADIADQPQQYASKRDWVTSIVRSHYNLNMDQKRYARALDFLSIVRPMYPQDLPATVLDEFAHTHELLAEQRRSQTTADDEQRARNNRDAAIHFELAGDYFHRHARKVTITDDEAHGDSLWKAAHNYDSAQLWDKSIKVYLEFVMHRDDDPRQLDALNRLGMAMLADEKYTQAIEHLKALIERHPNSPAARASFVPLARGYIATNEEELAERLLKSVITDHPAITPESLDYREALIELGRLHYNQSKFEKAISVLDMAVQRYGDTPSGPAVKFRLGDSYRQSVEALDRSLEQPMPQTRKQAMQQQRLTRLRQAQALFDDVIRDYEALSQASLSQLDEVFLRNAYFYRADCSYDQQRYQTAITLYDLAAKRYEDHPASLVALIQQVNAHSELGQHQAARVANDRARYQLRRIPDEAFDDPSLPMSRAHWEDWLKWTSELKLFDQQAC